MGQHDYNPFEGTVIGPDGNRYDPDDPNLPTSAPDRMGKFLTSGSLDNTIGQVLPARNATQVITRTATGGTSVFTFTDGEDIDVDATGISVVGATTAAELKTAVIAAVSDLDVLSTADLGITGSAGGPFTVEIKGQYAGIDNPPVFEIEDAGATGGTVLIATTEPGRAATSGVDGLVVATEDHDERLDDLEDA